MGRERVIKEFRPGTRTQVTVAVWGDEVVGRALMLLLRGSGYDATFLPASSSSLRSTSLEGIRLLLLTPTPMLSTERREALLSLLKDTPEVARMPVLELVESVTSFEAPPQGRGARSEARHAVLWPCRIEELERRIALIL